MKKTKNIFLSIFLTFPFFMGMYNIIQTHESMMGFFLQVFFACFVLYNIWIPEKKEQKKNIFKAFLFTLCEIIVALAWLSNTVVYLGFIFSKH